MAFNGGEPALSVEGDALRLATFAGGGEEDEPARCWWTGTSSGGEDERLFPATPTGLFRDGGDPSPFIAACSRAPLPLTPGEPEFFRFVGMREPCPPSCRWPAVEEPAAPFCELLYGLAGGVGGGVILRTGIVRPALDEDGDERRPLDEVAAVEMVRLAEGEPRLPGEGDLSWLDDAPAACAAAADVPVDVVGTARLLADSEGVLSAMAAPSSGLVSSAGESPPAAIPRAAA